mmetsp:Transcript_65456/g.147674  ORF Transcript_65456/g.147674 Transcript_65456/m.147674 type:complete len:280 (+) Transcript_65456:737-1576(+)
MACSLEAPRCEFQASHLARPPGSDIPGRFRASRSPAVACLKGPYARNLASFDMPSRAATQALAASKVASTWDDSSSLKLPPPAPPPPAPSNSSLEALTPGARPWKRAPRRPRVSTAAAKSRRAPPLSPDPPAPKAAEMSSLSSQARSSLSSVSLCGPRDEEAKAADPSSAGGPYRSIAWRWSVFEAEHSTRVKPHLAARAPPTATGHRPSSAEATCGSRNAWARAVPGTMGSTRTKPATKGRPLSRAAGGEAASSSAAARAWRAPTPLATKTTFEKHAF